MDLIVFKNMEKEEKIHWLTENLPALLDNPENLVEEYLYKDHIFPILLDGYNKHDPWSIIWLVKTFKNIMADDYMSDEIGYISALDILKMYHEKYPKNVGIKELLLEKSIFFLNKCTKGGDMGVVYGNEGAIAWECELLLKDGDAAQKLDAKGEHQGFFIKFRAIVNQYMQNLNNTH